MLSLDNIIALSIPTKQQMSMPIYRQCQIHICMLRDPSTWSLTRGSSQPPRIEPIATFYTVAPFDGRPGNADSQLSQ